MKADNDNAPSWVVYTLADSRKPEDVRYVGLTKDAGARLTKHRKPQASDKSHRANWVRSVIRDGGDIVLSVIKRGLSEEHVKTEEVASIEEYRTAGYRLVNGTDGGDGMLNPTPELRAKLSAAVKASMTSEVREKMSTASRGKKKSPEHVARVAKAKTGFRHSDETRAKLSSQRLGRPLSHENKESIRAAMADPEVRAKISAANRGRKLTPEHIEKVAAANRGRKLSAEHCAKISKANKGRQRTESHAANIAASKRMAGPKSGIYKGITRSGKKWMTVMRLDKKTTYIGTFDTAVEAAMAFDRAAFSTWGFDCYLNFPNEFIWQEAA